MSEPLLSLTDVAVSYATNGPAEKVAIQAMSFDVHPGESLGIAGETGAGKSTLARAIMALEPLKKGRITFDQSVISSADNKGVLSKNELRKLRRRFQILFQDPAASLSPRMTVEMIIAEGPLAHELWPKKDVEQKVAQALESVNLSPSLAARFPNELSGGERRRIALARVKAVEPELLLLDEPTAGLDHKNVDDVLELLASAAKQKNLATIVISHDLAVLRRLCDRIAVMRQGEIVECAETEVLFENPASEYTQALIQASQGSSAWIG